MNHYTFHDEATLAEQAESWGRKAVNLKLIPSFVVRHYADSPVFYIPGEEDSIGLTAPEAYLKFKKLVEASLSKL
ncbi:hypothetical protein NIES2107_47490 [Nostoc carneum NIES-2107]|nr:hypothetical protein NIES2107_47490 [Nostoc carneum NIES-2107]